MADPKDDNDSGESLRDALDAAFEQHADDGPGADAPAAAPAAAKASTDEAAAGRDPAGRFASKSPKEAPETAQAGPAPAAGTPSPTGVMPAAPAPAELKAPASWTPAAREKWAGLDPDIRAEVHRREGEAQRVLQQSAQHRQFNEAFENVVRPYEMFIRSENSNPLLAVQNLMQTAAEFRVGTPARKVELVAGICRNFGIDLEALDTALAAQMTGQPQQQAQGQQQFRDPRVDQMLAQQQQQSYQSQQVAEQAVQQELQQFGQTHEFFGDVAALMGDVMAMAAKRGETLDLEKAYARACGLHDGVSTILAQRQAGASKPGPSPAALRAKRAAASVRNDATPHEGGMVPKDDSIRASIEAAFDHASNA